MKLIEIIDRVIIMSYKFPSDLKYTATHEWVRINSSLAVAGITDYAQHQLGDVVFVELPSKGMVFEKESNAGEIESVKAVGEFLMPLSGERLHDDKRRYCCDKRTVS